MPLKICDRAIALMPERLVVGWGVHERFCAQQLGVHADDEHLLVVGSVEDADPPAFRQIPRGAPEKVMLQFGSTRMFETEHLATLGVDPGHHMPNGPVFSGR